MHLYTLVKAASKYVINIQHLFVILCCKNHFVSKSDLPIISILKIGLKYNAYSYFRTKYDSILIRQFIYFMLSPPRLSRNFPLIIFIFYSIVLFFTFTFSPVPASSSFSLYWSAMVCPLMTLLCIVLRAASAASSVLKNRYAKSCVLNNMNTFNSTGHKMFGTFFWQLTDLFLEGLV